MSNRLLDEIGQEFNRRYEKSESNAIEYYRHSLMENFGELVPDIIPLKDFSSLLLEILNYLKTMGSSKAGLTREQILQGTTMLLTMENDARKTKTER